MSAEGKAKRLATLKPWKKGQSGNPYGRPKKNRAQLKDLGYTDSEINACGRAMLAKSVLELLDISSCAEESALRRIIARSLVKSFEQSELGSMDVLMNKIVIRKKGEDTISVEHKIVDSISDETRDPVEASRIYQEIMKAALGGKG
jgi:hypothetical protein